MFKLLVVAPKLLCSRRYSYLYNHWSDHTLGQHIISSSVVWLLENAGIIGGFVYGLSLRAAGYYRYAPYVWLWTCSSSVLQAEHIYGRYCTSTLRRARSIRCVGRSGEMFGTEEKMKEGLAMTSGISGLFGRRTGQCSNPPPVIH